MFLINEVTKQLIYSHGKNGTTSVADPLQKKDSNWHQFDLNEPEVPPYGMLRDYTAYILFRDPKDRYISGLLEDISMFMLPDDPGLTYSKQIINLNPNLHIVSHKQLSDNKEAALLLEKNVKYFDHMLTHLFKYNGSDYSLSDSYHVGNWLWEAFAIHSLVDTTFWIDLPNLDTFFKKNFDLELPHMNVKSSKDKAMLKKAINHSHHNEKIDDYLDSENTMYNIIMKNRMVGGTLKDFSDNKDLAHKISYCVFNNLVQKKGYLHDKMIMTLIKLIFQKHWDGE